MTLFELRELIETSLPWWFPIAVIGVAVMISVGTFWKPRR